MKHIDFFAAVAALLISPTVLADTTCKSDPIGDALQILLPAAALGLSAWHEMDSDGMEQLALSFGVAEGTAQGLKHAIPATRPCGGAHSFPSGHTTAAFTAAAYVQKRYGGPESIPFYALAAVTGYERVRSRHHRIGDVFGGAAIGMSSSWFFTAPKAAQEPQVSVVPNARGASLVLTASW